MARNCRGETLAETLVSMLISALSLLLLVTMIQSSAKLITNSETAMDTNIREVNKLNDPGASGVGTSGTVKIQGITNADFTLDVQYYRDASGTAVSYVIKSDSP